MVKPMSVLMIDSVLSNADWVKKTPDTIDALAAGSGEKPKERAVPRSLLELRSMTISIDFDRTFSADPKMWGEFAMQCDAAGNTVVMISRREDTPKNKQEIMDAIGEHAHAFSKIMLIGADMLKADAAAAAGIKVNIWIDDAPETVKG